MQPFIYDVRCPAILPDGGGGGGGGGRSQNKGPREEI